MEDLRKTVRATLYERITSPLYGTFIFSWIISNWKAFYITIFIKAEILKENKLDYIINTLYSGCWVWTLCKLLLIPAVSTFIFIWFMPILVNKAFKANEKFKTARRKVKSESLGEVPIPMEKHLNIIAEYEKDREKFSGILEEMGEWEKTEQDNKNKLQAAINESQNLNKQNNKLIIENEKLINEQSRIIAEKNKINPCLSDMFSGTWINNYMDSHGRKDAEIFEIRDGYKYFTNNAEKFHIDQYSIDINSGSIKFRKVGVSEPGRTINVILRLVDKKTYKGEEMDSLKGKFENTYEKKEP